MSDTSLNKREDKSSVQAREETRASERYVKPAVDFIETEAILTLIANSQKRRSHAGSR